MEQTIANNSGGSSKDFVQAIKELAGSVGERKNEAGKNTLISIRELKKYFPVKGHKNMFVKANDGINLDVYEGETLGLVGESGCGKSTLGRTLLQLYPQTEGKTLFYGEPLSKVKPKYILSEIKNLRQNKGKLLKLYSAAGANEASRKAAHNMFLDMAYVFGGLLLAPDEGAVVSAYLEDFAGKGAGKIEALRDAGRQNAGDDIFNKLEGMRDSGVDLGKLTYDEMRPLRCDMQIIFQDPYSSLNPRMTVGQIIGEGPLTHGFFPGEGAELQNHVMEVMEKCGLAPYMIHRYPHQFSGGQRQRIGIARALAVNPKFVVCDEAVSALDVSIQSQILNLLSDLREREKLTYLFISHGLSVVKYISDRIGVMYLGSMVELAPSAEIFKRPLHPYTEALLSAIPTTNVNKPKNSIILEGDIPSPINPPKGCKFHTRCRYVKDICKEQIPEFKEQEAGHFVACHHCLG
ncbi:MAG: ATP-binding cassette domain-containing protein [Treponema sp.]|nr:ATP-binding cassette domain-containing protein [Treponema sp.]